MYGSSEKLKLLVFVDRSEGESDEPLLNIPNFTNGKYLYVEKGSFKELKDLPEPNMGDPKMLSDFVEWGITNYPSDKYMLILSDHGGAWPGYGGDESTENSDDFDFNEVKKGIEDGLKNTKVKKLDIMGFDACLMATYESAKALKPYADYYLASEETEPGHGWDYNSLKIIADNPKVTPLEIGTSIINGFEKQAVANDSDNEITLSLVDLSKIDNLDESLKKVTDKLTININKVSAEIGKERAKTIEYGRQPNPAGNTNMVDMGHFFELLGKKNPDILNECKDVNDALKNTVLYMKNGKGQKNSNGLSIYFPQYQKFFKEDYIKLNEASIWNEFLTKYFDIGKDYSKRRAGRFN